MRTITDLHIHSRFSRACSQELTVPNLAQWARRKGIDLLGSGDFTHPAWIAELERDLVEVAPGTYAYPAEPGARFVLSSEVACIYKRGGKVRRVHLVLLAPDFAAVHKIRAALEKLGKNLKADGRPILGMDSVDLLHLIQEADPRTLLIPAHAWTPWFAIFGSESGFDSITECFGDDAKHIHAIETGLSSDPAMNWRLSQLDGVLLLSHSDAHSLRNLGREADVFDLPERTYAALYAAIAGRDKKALVETIEFFPEEGKYHLDGHRLCGVRMKPEETAKRKGICPACGKQVTVGVLARVAALADRPDGGKPPDAVPFRSIVPLEQVIGEALDVGPASKKVQQVYQRLTDRVGSEFAVLLDVPLAQIAAEGGQRVAEAIRRVRAAELTVLGGFDGQYGTVRIFKEDETEAKQKSLL
ncbi:DNA helicase UvrD [Patescibacteria group bacterium]|nr:MAG: DNA helicase UvrD [Patescibacteria group bacterium]